LHLQASLANLLKPSSAGSIFDRDFAALSRLEQRFMVHFQCWNFGPGFGLLTVASK
jgi:hypothetical protein